MSVGSIPIGRYPSRKLKAYFKVNITVASFKLIKREQNQLNISEVQLTETKDAPRDINVSIKELLEAGVHFGHQTYRWNPKMKRFIYEERNGIHIIDLSKTMYHLRKACDLVAKQVAKGQSVLFVGTKKQAKLVVQDCAEACGEYFVGERWLGGMMTNLSTIRQSIKKLEKIEKTLASGAEGLTKKEVSLMMKKQVKLDKNLCGIRAMRKAPGLLVVVDPVTEHLAVAEAKKLGIPVLAITDTNGDPDAVDFVIPANDDALKSNKLILTAIQETIKQVKEENNIPLKREDAIKEAKSKAPKKVSLADADKPAVKRVAPQKGAAKQAAEKAVKPATAPKAEVKAETKDDKGAK
jgi:small subunit ribosomal protein S2